MKTVTVYFSENAWKKHTRRFNHAEPVMGCQRVFAIRLRDTPFSCARTQVYSLITRYSDEEVVDLDLVPYLRSTEVRLVRLDS